MPSHYESLGYSARQIEGIRLNEASIARSAKFMTSPTIGLTSPIGPNLPTFPVVPTLPGLGGVGQAACGLLPAGAARTACLAVAGLLPGGGTTPATPLQTGPECPKGMVRIRNTCVAPGDVFPGGDPFLTRAGGVPVAGAFGLPGFSPLLVQQPVRRCNPGFALAKDGICYVRSLIPRKFRAHPPAKRPPLTGADASALRRIGSLQTKVKRLAKVAGLSMTSRRSAGPRKRARK